jgi:predicted  nucleic acid-binding Zn-ribbon protein
MDEERKGRLKDEMEKLEQMRDELRLQAHLFKAEVKDEWEDLEDKIAKIRHNLRPVQKAAEETLEEVGEATGLLIDSVFDGFKRLRDSLK